MRDSGQHIFVRPCFDRADDLANAESIMAAVINFPEDEMLSLTEIRHKSKSNLVGAVILSKLGVHLEPSSRSGSISSIESNQRSIVYAVL